MTKNRKAKRNKDKQNQQNNVSDSVQTTNAPPSEVISEAVPASADVCGEGFILDGELIEPERLQPATEIPQSETPTADMPAPKPKPKPEPKKVMTCQIAGCNAEVVDRGNGQLQCKGPRRHTFVDEPETIEPPKPKKPAEIIPEDDKRPRCPWCKALCTEIVDKKTGTITYKCRGPRRHVWEK